MRIGLGATLLARGLAHQQLDGIGYYTQELAQRLSSVGCDWCPMVFGPTTLAQIGDRPISRLPRYGAAAMLSVTTGMGFVGHRPLRDRMDLFHATDHHIPRLPGIPVLATLMDAIPLSHPEWASSSFRSLKNKVWRQASRWADHVVTISDYAKSQIIEHFGIPAQQISVVSLGVDQRFYDRLAPAIVQSVCQVHSLQRPYFLSIGTLQPRKNIHRLIDAYQSLPPSVLQTHDLVIVGRNGWGSEALVQRLRSLSPQSGVRWLGGVPDLDKRALLQNATALVFPSLSEGFGLPVLEAFASQTPVITSNTTSLPEISANAALLIDPSDSAAMAHAMQNLADNPSLAAQLRTQGLARSKQYNWQTCAQQTAAIYQRMLGRTP
jgi:glycosyltransferase involved in cell wall biosynthesis